MKIVRPMLGFLLLVSLAGNISALTVKLGTLAPADTPWDVALHTIAREWKEISGGAVELKIYGGGIAGDEADMLRKVRLGDRLQCAALSGVGMNRITSEMLIMNLPLLFDGYGELQYVIEKMSPTFEEIIEKKGLKLLGWTTTGWVHFFGKQPIVTPEDLRKLKFAVSAEDEEILYAWRASGFDAIPLHTTEILTGLQTGMVESFHAPPILAAMYQWFGLSPYMNSLEVAPLIAGFVINERTWRRIPARFRDDLIGAVQGVLTDLYNDTKELEEQAIDIMKQNGLVINEVPESSMAEWRDVMSQGYELLVGTAISPEIFEQTVKYRDEFRSAHESQ